jgi:hypothetical protein
MNRLKALLKPSGPTFQGDLDLGLRDCRLERLQGPRKL